MNSPHCVYTCYIYEFFFQVIEKHGSHFYQVKESHTSTTSALKKMLPFERTSPK